MNQARPSGPAHAGTSTNGHGHGVKITIDVSGIRARRAEILEQQGAVFDIVLASATKS